MTGRKSGRREPLLALLSVAVVFTVVGLALAEWVARALVPLWDPEHSMQSLWRYDPDLGWAQTPNRKVEIRTRRWTFRVAVNADGLRGPDPQGSPTDRTLLLLGDSVGWGFGVDDEETVAAQVQGRCPGWEVINASIVGYSTDQQYLWYQSHGHRYGPDMVLLLFNWNDIQGNESKQMYGYAKPRFVQTKNGIRLDNTPVPPPGRVKMLRSWLCRRSFLCIGSEEALRLGTLSGDGDVEPFATDLQMTRALLLHFAKGLAAENVRFAWVLVPGHPWGAPRLRQWMKSVGNEAGVPVVDLHPILEESARREGPVLLQADYHWNARGHRVAGSEIAKFLGCKDW